MQITNPSTAPSGEFRVVDLVAAIVFVIFAVIVVVVVGAVALVAIVLFLVAFDLRLAAPTR